MIYGERMGGWKQRELCRSVGSTEGDCWGIPNMKGVRAEGLRLCLGIYVLISRRGKTPRSLHLVNLS